MSLKAAIDWDKELNRCLSKIKMLIVLCFVGRSACQRGLQEKHPRVGAAGGGDFLADWPATFQLPHKVCGRSAVVAYRSYSMFVHQRWRSGTNFGRLCSLACCTLNRSGNINRSGCSEPEELWWLYISRYLPLRLSPWWCVGNSLKKIGCGHGAELWKLAVKWHMVKIEYGNTCCVAPQCCDITNYSPNYVNYVSLSAAVSHQTSLWHVDVRPIRLGVCIYESILLFILESQGFSTCTVLSKISCCSKDH